MKVALYTTIYPGVESFLKAWKQTVLEQTDCDFDIWVGVDGFSLEESEHLLKGLKRTIIVMNDKPELKAHIRKKALSKMSNQYDGLILVDSDDLLENSRVASAREQLLEYDAIGCAMHLVDAEGDDLNVRFGRECSNFVVKDIIEFNQYGFSNTAYRSAVLKKCLNIPEACKLVDWFLITNAWLSGASIYFDPIERMRYRQHSKNTTQVLPPFDVSHIRSATNCVLQHFSLLLENIDEINPSHQKIIEDRKNAVIYFNKKFSEDLNFSEKYVQEINKLSQEKLWWSCVANSNLEELWNPSR